MTAKIAIFPGSFDPLTNGHLEVIREGLRLFDRVIVAIGVNQEKKSFFSVPERLHMIEEAVASERCSVKSFEGLVANFAQKEGALVLLRGLRTESDFSYEMPMAMTNKKLAPKTGTIFIPTTQESHYISSSLVREVAFHRGDVSAFVPATILAHIKEKLG